MSARGRRPGKLPTPRSQAWRPKVSPDSNRQVAQQNGVGNVPVSVPTSPNQPQLAAQSLPAARRQAAVTRVKVPITDSYKKAYEEKYHVCLKAENLVWALGHTHPNTAFERGVAERRAFELAKSAAASLQAEMVEVGGNVRRTRSEHYTDVAGKPIWVSQPNLLPDNPHSDDDDLRSCSCEFGRMRTCPHGAPSTPAIFWGEDVMTTKRVVFVGIDVLYYITPREMYDILRDDLSRFYAVLHLFPGDGGHRPTLVSADQAETRWERTGPDVVETLLAGCKMYRHSAMDWLAAGAYGFSDGTLTWDVRDRFGDNVVVCFARTRQMYSALTMTQLDRPGDVTKALFTDYDVALINTDWLVLTSKTRVSLRVPTVLFWETVGKFHGPRSESHMQLVLKWFENQIRDYKGKATQAHLASHMTEIVNLAALYSAHRELMANQALKAAMPLVQQLNNSYRWAVPRLRGAVETSLRFVLNCSLVALMVSLSVLAWSYDARLGGPMAVSAILLMFIAPHVFAQPLVAEYADWKGANESVRRSLFTRLYKQAETAGAPPPFDASVGYESYWWIVMGAVLGALLGALCVRGYTLCLRKYSLRRQYSTYYSIMDMCFRNTPLKPLPAGTRWRPPPDAECVPRARLRIIGPIPPGVLLCVPRSCGHNENVAMRNRVLMATPECKMSDKDLYAPWKAWFDEGKTEWLFGTNPESGADPDYHVPVAPLDFDAWLSRFPLRRRTVLVNAMKNAIIAPTTDKRMNVKVEILPVRHPLAGLVESSPGAYTWTASVGLSPRAIMVSDSTYQCALGPQIFALTLHVEHLFGLRTPHAAAEIHDWSDAGKPPTEPDFTRKLNYAGGSTAEDLGEWFAMCVEDGYIYPVVGDSERFDAHAKRKVLELAQWVLSRFADLTADFRKVWQLPGMYAVVTANGGRATIEVMRMTGDNDTAVGNTIIQMTKLALMSLMARIDIRVCIMGDDVLAMCRSLVDAHKLAESPIPRAMGFEDTFQVFDSYWKATFCSKRPIPVADGAKIVFAPMFGRMFSKMFAYVHNVGQPDRTLNDVAMNWKHEASFVPFMRVMPVFQLQGGKFDEDHHLRATSAHVPDLPRFAEFMDAAYDIPEMVWHDLTDYLSRYQIHPGRPQYWDHPAIEKMVIQDVKDKDDQSIVVEAAGAEGNLGASGEALE